MGLFSTTMNALKRGLSRTRETMGSPLNRLLKGQRIDADAIDAIEACLLQADVGTRATDEIIATMRSDAAAGKMDRGEEAIDFLQTQLAERLGEQTPLATTNERPLVILVAGVNGVGKTTSVAKIAHALRAEGRSVLLAAADTFRAGAVEQLVIWGDRLGVDVVRGTTGADPAAVVWDAMDAALARDVDVLLVDTAGRMHTEQGLMRQLTKIRDVLAKRIPSAPHEVLLVLDATQGQNAFVQAHHFTEAIDVSGIFLAKLDGTAKGGIVVAIATELGIPVKLVGVGERPEDVEPFDPPAFVAGMFE
ncbi:MAG: signal recognition particle-docking protein FtsY [Phycisphaerales bacterium]|jgi:fused signal recognition particle receptor|nr:signal recognition particle-docking protein FtsY [Phycisphaerales bacterium]MDP6312365.1 signal recognition particle-docking protein FtsY [Phycisphaerales bacterium]MDP7188250.1 signal recognition particle-docking protein FtsY [Phycisphaerales bacterium]|tara:strand:- start:1694 stop:2611 length:918 start_codon:yes stop_codon:yes gene_type:complete